MLNLKTILYPTDLSKPADYALAVAGALAHDHGAKLVILTVLPPPVSAPEVFLPPPAEDYKELAWKAFRELEAQDPKMRELRVEAMVADGYAGEEIERVAKELGVDMIVMGTHGRTGLKRMLMGSVAEEVLRRAPCPVLTVKSPALLSGEPAPPSAGGRGYAAPLSLEHFSTSHRRNP